MHLFYRINRVLWQPAAGAAAKERLTALCAANAAASFPRLTCYANLGNKADLAFLLQTQTAEQLAQLHRDLEAAFPPGVLVPVYNFLSVTELTEYTPGEADARARLIAEKMTPDTPEFNQRLTAELARMKEYNHYRLYPELPDWELMGFYPMSKRRQGADNWYMLDFDTRKRLMGSHGRTGRKYANRIVQMITGCTGLDDWEWGVTLMAHQMDDLKSIVYEMRFDEVSARYGEFGAFYVNLRLSPAELWAHLHL